MLHKIRALLSYGKGRIFFILKMTRAKKIKISLTDEIGEKIREIKPVTMESMPLIRTANLVQGGEVIFHMPNIDLQKYENAYVFAKSDFIISEGKAVWQKYHTPQFTKIVPADKELLTRREDCLFVRKSKIEIAVDLGFSLCGVHSDTWSHFIVQYLPKLYMLPILRLEEKRDITIIIPRYSDPQICEIIETYLTDKPGIKLLKLDEKKVVYCKELYHITSTSLLSDHADYISSADVLIPSLVGKLLKENLINNYAYDKTKTSKTEENKNTKKLYINRRGQIRNLLNSNEVREFFEKKGFEVIEPHKMELYEKIQLFKMAKIVVGPYSSGFSNLIFSQSGTKVLCFSNFQRVFEGYHGFLKRDFGIDYNLITGTDLNPSDPHSSYTIPLDEIKAFCKTMGI